MIGSTRTHRLDCSRSPVRDRTIPAQVNDSSLPSPRYAIGSFKEKQHRDPLGSKPPRDRDKRDRRRWTKMAAENKENKVARDYLREMSFAFMTSMTTEARAKGTAKWITDHVNARRRYCPPKERGRLGKELRHERKALAGRYYQLLSIGGYLYRIMALSPSKS